MTSIIRRGPATVLDYGFLLSTWQGSAGDYSEWEMEAGDRTKLSHLRIVVSGTLQAFGPDGARPIQFAGDHSDMLPPIVTPGTYRLVCGGQFEAWCIERKDQADYDYLRQVLTIGERFTLPKGRYAALVGDIFNVNGQPLFGPVLAHAKNADIDIRAEHGGVAIQFWVGG